MIKARPSAASISVNFRTQGSQKPMQVVNPAFEPSCPSDTYGNHNLNGTSIQDVINWHDVGACLIYIDWCTLPCGSQIPWRQLGTRPSSSTTMLNPLWPHYYALFSPQVSRKNTWWRHQMETFSALLAVCEGNSSVTDEFPSQRPVTRRFDVFFDHLCPQQTAEQTIETPVMWDTITPIMASL